MTPETKGKGAHVLDDALDYAAGRLPPERKAEIEAHLATCSVCSVHYTFVTGIESDVTRTGARHLRPERVVAIVDLPAEALPPDERAHLDACPRCREDLVWAHTAPPMPALDARSLAAEEAGAARPVADSGQPGSFLAAIRRTLSGWRPIPTWGWGLAGAAVACLLVVLQLTRTEDADLYKNLARIAPLPAPQMTRGADETAEFRRVLQGGIDAYVAGDYRRAGDSLGRAASLAPARSDVSLYLGSSLLMAGKAREAVAPLRRAAETAPSDRLREESLWQLAQAHLAAGDRPPAEAALREVVKLDLDRRQDAAALLDRIARR